MRDLILGGPDRLVITLVNQSRGNQIEKPPPKRGGEGADGGKGKITNPGPQSFLMCMYVLCGNTRLANLEKEKRKKGWGQRRRKEDM